MIYLSVAYQAYRIAYSENDYNAFIMSFLEGLKLEKNVKERTATSVTSVQDISH